MNKKGLIGVSLAVLFTAVSTVVIVYAKNTSDKYTKNVMKALTTNNNKISQEKGTKDEKTKKYKTFEIIDKRIPLVLHMRNMSEDEIPYVLSTNVESLKKNPKSQETTKEILQLKEFEEDYNNGFDIEIRSDSQTKEEKYVGKRLSISDAEAIEKAKEAIKYYTGENIDEIMSKDSLKAEITREEEPYAWGPDILVSFNNDNDKTYKDNIFVSISEVDGKVYAVNVMLGNYSKLKVDKNKVKAAAVNFLKHKGFGGNYTSITVDNEKSSIGIAEAKCKYEDGTEILLEFKISDYSIVSFAHYNLKTMKFINN